MSRTQTFLQLIDECVDEDRVGKQGDAVRKVARGERQPAAPDVYECVVRVEIDKIEKLVMRKM